MKDMVRMHYRLVSLVALASLLMARPVRCSADVNICAILGENLQRFYMCARAVAPKVVVQKFDEVIRMFPGKTQSQVTRMMCKSVGDNSDIVFEEFIENFTDEEGNLIRKLSKECASKHAN